MKEEIEEQSEDYEMDCIADVYRDDVCTIPYAYSAQKLEQAFQDGAKWGMEHAIEWHDLKKNPNDLPKLESKDFLWSITVANQLGKACHYNYRKSRWETPIFTEIEADEVIAWCELPQYFENPLEYEIIQ